MQCLVCGEHSRRAKFCSRRCQDRQRILDGSNMRRMHEREAKKLGLTLEEYEQWGLEQQAQREVERERREIERANRRAVRDAARLTPEQQRLKFNAYMLARYHADPDNWSTKHKRRRLFERDGWKCRACGVKVDDTLPCTHPRRAVAMHILAKATGGEWTNDNMATGCHRCNVADGVNKIPIQFALQV